MELEIQRFRDKEKLFVGIRDHHIFYCDNKLLSMKYFQDLSGKDLLGWGYRQ